MKAYTVGVPEQAEQRNCTVMEAKVNVALILRVMLGADDAMQYLIRAKVPKHVAIRVIMSPHKCRRLDAIADELRASMRTSN